MQPRDVVQPRRRLAATSSSDRVSVAWSCLVLAGLLLLTSCGADATYGSGPAAATGTGTGSATATATDQPAPGTCATPLPAQPGSADASIRVAGKTRTYSINIPYDYDGSKSLPLVMTFHGSGANALRHLALTGLETESNSAGFVLVTPNAVNGRWDLPTNAGEATTDTAFITVLLSQLHSKYCLDSQRQYASGMSLGSAMAFLLACAPESQFAAFGGVGASFYRSVCQRSAPAPLMYFHGTADKTVPFKGGTALEQAVAPVETTMKEWAKHNQCPPTPATNTISDVTAESWSGCRNNASVIFYRIAGGGHTWPGASELVATFLESSLGKTTQTVNANELMWKFFQRYTLSQRNAN